LTNPLRRLGAAVIVSLPLLISGQLPAAAATTAPVQNATVTITDSGMSPSSVTIGLGGTVNWVNKGNNTHTATTGSAPFPFDTGGLAPNQTASFSLSLAGTYTYTSATDCLGGNNTPNFNCGPYTVIVTSGPGAGTAAAPAPAAPAPVAPAPASAAPTTAAAPGTAQQNVTVTITDKGFSPTALTITAGGTVNFTNSGSNVHTGTTNGGGNPVPVDTGGLAPGQTSSQTLGLPGTYTFTSATDCMNSNNTPGFNCGPVTVTVTSTTGPATVPAAVAPATAPAPAGPVAPAAAPSPVGTTTAPQNATVILTDQNGFTPNTVTIVHGATITWFNNGNNVHTVTSNPGYYNAFDSGGLNPGQKWSYNFTIPGTYGYHSATEASYVWDTTTSSTAVSYSYNGTIVVQ